MLPKKRRIQKKYFTDLVSQGKRFNSQNITLFLSKNTTEVGGKSKFSFSVSKKVAKEAVKRNKLRRRGYSVISKSIDFVKDGYFLFFSFKKGAEKLKFIELEREIQQLLSISGVLK